MKTAHGLIKQMERQVKRMDNEIDAAHREVQRMENTRDLARKILEQNLAAYANLHFEGATIAAEKGDTRPAEWALMHAKSEGKTVVDPPAKLTPDTGVRVFVGVGLGALPPQSVQAEIFSPMLEAEVVRNDNNE
jgi:hypothetical protein